MKSVKTLSEELNVSKQTIFNNIKRLNIETVKQDNTSFIKKNIDVEKITQRVNENKKKYGFESTTKGYKKIEQDNITKESKSDNQIIKLLESQISSLNNQLEKQEKRHEMTIEFYRKELQERSKLLENQQVLALESNKKIQKLENQLEEERQLKGTFYKNTNGKQNSKAQETTFIEDNQNINQNQKEKQSTDIEIKNTDVNEDEKNREEVLKEQESPNNGNLSSGVKSNLNDRTEKAPKKGFWNRLFGN